MSLLFSGALTDQVNCGGANSSLANLQRWAVAALIFPTSVPADAGICWKGTAGAGNERFFFFFGPGLSNALEIGTARATTYAEARAPWANFAVEGTNKWLFVAGTLDAADADCRLWMGDKDIAATEPSAYTVQTAGAGGYTANTAHDQILGNRDPSLSNHSFDGRIGIVGIWDLALWNRPFDEDDARALQANFASVAGPAGLWALGLEGNGVGQQRDLSGNGNHGVVSGATAAAHMPILTFLTDKKPRVRPRVFAPSRPR